MTDNLNEKPWIRALILLFIVLVIFFVGRGCGIAQERHLRSCDPYKIATLHKDGLITCSNFMVDVVGHDEAVDNDLNWAQAVRSIKK